MNSGCRGNETGGVRRFRPEWCRAVSELAGGVYQADREILFSGGGVGGIHRGQEMPTPFKD